MANITTPKHLRDSQGRDIIIRNRSSAKYKSSCGGNIERSPANSNWSLEQELTFNLTAVRFSPRDYGILPGPSSIVDASLFLDMTKNKTPMYCRGFSVLVVGAKVQAMRAVQKYFYLCIH